MSRQTSHPELRAQLRALASRVPPGVGDWSHAKAAGFKDSLRAALRAADHPLATAWMLRCRIAELSRYHRPDEAGEAA